MHRSGTSVLTGVLAGLGLALPQPADQWDPEPSNPDHFESKSMVVFDQDLLEFLGGSWHGPPDLPAGWEARPELEAFDPAARGAASQAFPEGGPLVWKDPQICLLLPYWRRLLPQPIASVLMWRSPREVARSLRERDGFSLELGTALWEHYNRAALDNLEGYPVYVTSYVELLDDPVGLSQDLADWLDSLEFLEPHRGTWDPERAASVVTESLRHQDVAYDGPLLDSQEALLERLGQLRGGHHSLPGATLKPLSPWGPAVIEEHRLVCQRDALNEELRTDNEQLVTDAAKAFRRAERAERALRALRASTSWRLTRPLRAIGGARARRRGAP